MRQVIYVAGFGRSGSTLFGRMLGAVPGFLYTGEFSHLWQVARHDGRICGCGARFRECPFWTKVLTEAYGDDVSGGLDELDRSVRGVARRRYVPLLRWPRLQGRTFRDRVRRYHDAARPVLRALHAVTDADVLVDSSGVPVVALTWAQLPDMRVSVVHLVRDPRAVANSLARHRRNPGFEDQRPMLRLSAHSTAVRWDVSNVLAEVARSARVRYVLIRYEDYVADPAAAIGSLVDMVSDRPRPIDFVRHGTVDLPVAHTIAGNRMRFHNGRIELSRDDLWREEFPRRSSILVTALTLPLMRRYGYPISPGRARGSIR